MMWHIIQYANIDRLCAQWPCIYSHVDFIPSSPFTYTQAHVHVHTTHSRRAQFTARDNLQLNDFNALQRHKYYSIFGHSNEFVSDVLTVPDQWLHLCLNACMYVGMYVCRRRRRRRSHRYSFKNKFFCEFQWYQASDTLFGIKPMKIINCIFTCS